MTELIRVDPAFKKEIERIQAELREAGLNLTIPQTTKLLVKTQGKPDVISSVLEKHVSLPPRKRKRTDVFDLI